MPTLLRKSTPGNEGTLRVSKALKHQVLLDTDEMQSLFKELGNFYLFAVSEPVALEEAQIEDFLTVYKKYIDALKNGQPLEDRLLRRAFSSAWTVDPSFLYAMEVAGGKFLVKPLRPVLQLQLHRFSLSDVDEKVHPLVLGPGSISWGVQFSFPQLFQDPKTEEIAKVPRDFPNSELYWKLSRWLRAHTVPALFLFKGKRVVSSLRIGKQSLSWINRHPHLTARGIQCVS